MEIVKSKEVMTKVEVKQTKAKDMMRHARVAKIAAQTAEKHVKRKVAREKQTKLNAKNAWLKSQVKYALKEKAEKKLGVTMAEKKMKHEKEVDRLETKKRKVKHEGSLKANMVEAHKKK